MYVRMTALQQIVLLSCWRNVKLAAIANNEQWFFINETR